MNHLIRVGVIGDFDPDHLTHIATSEALNHAAATLSATLDCIWLPTMLLEDEGSETVLEPFDALFCAPGSPYGSREGALRGIRFAREKGRPFIGTCGGFQYTLLEYARNVLGIRDAGHEESDPDASLLVISKLACSLAGTTQEVRMTPETLAHRSFGKERSMEQFRCSYGLNPEYRDRISDGDLRVSGVDSDGEVRIVELADHPFFLAALFVPQLSSSPNMPHPLITAYLKAALAFGS